MADGKYVLVSTSAEGITTILMNRPDKLNSWNGEMEAEFRKMAATIENELKKHRVLVIRGAGRAFCAGVDMGIIGTEQKLPPRELRNRMAIRHRFFDWVEQIEIPVVAAIHGYCLGGGLELALACDFRLLSADAKLAMPELTFGQVPGSGAASRLTALAGPSVAKDIIVTCRRLDAAEAAAIGLATRVYPAAEFDAKVQEFCGELAKRPPLAVAMVKQMVAAVQPADLSKARSIERLAQSALLNTRDLAEGLAAAAQKRPAQFTGD
ncbi:MAG: enoyl-CoA hydratase/isomerase family protein [Sphingobacteriales bacterium]|jgi:enoyl-CoA hydratase/carnithine racemase